MEKNQISVIANLVFAFRLLVDKSNKDSGKSS